MNSWSIWLPIVGLAGAALVIVSLAGGYFVNGQIASRANRKAATVTELVAKAQGVAAAARADDQKTHQKLDAALAKKAPREITEAQKGTFVQTLKDVPKGLIEVFIYDYRDPEVHGYADQIRALLIAAGFDCGDKVEVSAKPFSPEGLLVVAKDPVNAPGYAGAIQHAFGLIGIDAPGARDASMEQDRVVIVVGRRYD